MIETAPLLADVEDIIRAYWEEHPPARAIPPALL